MTRPNTLHKGFFVPNGSGVLDPVMAEPDQIDFNIAGNARWGVVIGCEVTVSAGTTAEVTTGIAVVDGVVVPVAGSQSVSLGSGSSQPRFDLVGVNGAGMLTVLAGAPAADPLFPDPPVGFTVLAAVLAPAGATSFGDYVVDKRHYLQTVLVASATGDDTVVLNRTGGNDTFRINAEGRLEWDNNSAALSASGDTITVEDDLVVTAQLTVQGSSFVLGDVVTTGYVTGKNFQRTTGVFPNTAENGTYLIKDGLPYMRRVGLWEQMLTTGTGGDQVGDIKQTLRTPDQMPGWLQLNGQTVNEADRPLLFQVGGLAGFITGTAPNRVMHLPDATDRFLLTGNTPGSIGGASVFHLELDHMPPHMHGVDLDPSGTHTHPASLSPAGLHRHLTVQFDPFFTSGYDGKHVHPVTDPGHVHNGAEWFAGTPSPIIALAWGGQNKLDGPINDGSHTYAVEPMANTVSAQTGISIGREGSQHQHLTEYEQNHVHSANIVAAGEHSHNVNENVMGNGMGVNFRPKYLTVFTYIKV